MQLKYELAHAVRVRSKHSDLNIRTKRVEGRPLANIVDMVEKGGCDLMVMGSPKIGVIEDRIFGYTNCRVVDPCNSPVLVIKKFSRDIICAISHGFDF